MDHVSVKENVELVKKIILTNSSITKFETIVATAEKMGKSISLATVSRIINEIKAKKNSDGHYFLPEDIKMAMRSQELKVILTECIIPEEQKKEPALEGHLSIIRTRNGRSHILALELDKYFKEELIDAIPFPNSVLVIAESVQVMKAIKELLPSD